MQARQVIRAAVVELWSRRTTLPQAVSTIPCFLCSLVNAVNVGGWTTLRCVVAVRSAFVMSAAVGGVGFGVAWGDVRVAGVGVWGVWGYGSRWAYCTFLGRSAGPGPRSTSWRAAVRREGPGPCWPAGRPGGVGGLRPWLRRGGGERRRSCGLVGRGDGLVLSGSVVAATSVGGAASRCPGRADCWLWRLVSWLRHPWDDSQVFLSNWR